VKRPQLQSKASLGSLGLVALLPLVILFSGSAVQAKTARHVHHVHFPFTYTGVGKQKSFRFHVSQASWNVEERNHPAGCARTLAVVGTNGYQVVQFHLQPSNGDYLRPKHRKATQQWSGWTANLVAGAYRDKAIQIKRGCRWWIRFTYHSFYG
jgi:hypothetical protein